MRKSINWAISGEVLFGVGVAIFGGDIVATAQKSLSGTWVFNLYIVGLTFIAVGAIMKESSKAKPTVAKQISNKKDLYRFLKILYENYYPNRYVSELDDPRLTAFANVFADAQRAKLIKIAPATTQITAARVMIEVEGIRFLSQLEMHESSLRLERFTIALIFLTAILAGITLPVAAQAILGLYTENLAYWAVSLFGMGAIAVVVIYYAFIRRG